MGYSVNDPNFRATLWAEFNQTKMAANFDNIIASELYDHTIDPHEAKNVADETKYKTVFNTLSNAIRSRFENQLDSLLP